ncbi:MAG: DUF1292 domain-containing protein [Lachnospiraceae bacterium]|nr:DUF1292 domain-containing protein [Lachnospiraceae bacterium]
MGIFNMTPEEEMTVEIKTDFGTYECLVLTILEVNKKDYIYVQPMVDEDDDLYGIYWIYGYKENPDNPNEEPELIYIDDDEELDVAEDAFQEYLDNQEFDEIIED